MEKRPRGRPPLDCKDINKRTFQRKKPETIERAQKKKCDSRISHTYKPCSYKSKQCVDSVKKSKGSCGEVRPKPKSSFKSKTEQKAELVKRCTEKGKSIGKKCTVPNTKRLVCHDAKLKKKTKEGEYIVGMYR